MDSRQQHHQQQHHQQQQCIVTQRPPKKPMCRLCRNHGKIRATRGHKHECPHKDCRCDKCMLTLENRRTNAVQVAHRRQEARAKKVEKARADAFSGTTSLACSPHLNSSLQVDYRSVESPYGFASSPAVRQWPLVIPLCVQQHKSSQHLHGSYYNYSSPYCYSMEQKGHVSPSVQSVTPCQRPLVYRNQADSFCSTESGFSCQSSLAQLQYRGPNGRSSSLPLAKPREYSKSQSVVADIDGTAHTSMVTHSSVESIVASLGIWNSVDERRKLQKSAVVAGDYSIASLLKDACVPRGDAILP